MKSEKYISRCNIAREQMHLLGILETEISRLCGYAQTSIHLCLHPPHTGSWALLTAVENTIGEIGAEKVFRFGELLQSSQTTGSGAAGRFAIVGATTYQRWINERKSEISDAEAVCR